MEINIENSTKENRDLLMSRFGSKAFDTIQLMLNYIPMYQGDLNPTWKYWNDVKNEIEKVFNKKLTKDFFVKNGFYINGNGIENNQCNYALRILDGSEKDLILGCFQVSVDGFVYIKTIPRLIDFHKAMLVDDLIFDCL
tara:strand:+ start:377 stop:793 length:417 start_codon:yes stop_codon:yes gene_type:complete